jgi:hypothetical protein
MPETKEQKLRLFCICGQKMKVSESMYGLPGKCIACRQKIRLPKIEEIPDGVSEIFLKDHPELLRTPPNKKLEEETAEALDALKSAKPLKKISADDDPTPITELDIADVSKVNRADYAGSIPLDPLESLQRLTSLQWKLERKLDKIRSVKPVDENLKAETKGHLTKLKQVRNDFDEQLRQRLMEAAIELTTTQEKIAHIQVSVRVSEISYDEFHEQVTRLRGRRDRMERRQQNLRGWIASVDPFAIGGYISMELDSTPEDGYRLFVPPEPEEAEGLLQAYTRGLKQSMKERSLAEQKLEEAKKIRDESGDALSQQTVAESRGERNRARGNVGFYQSRLKQLKKDLLSDIETAESQLDNARSHLSMNEITRSEFDKIESSIKRVKLDNTKGLSVIERALAANASSDIPHLRGTFLERLTVKNGGVAQWSIPLAWGSALLFAMSIFVPLVGNQSLVRSFLDYYAFGSRDIWWIVVPLLAGLSVGLGSMINKQTIRGEFLLGIGAIVYILMVYAVHESQYSLDPVASRFRTGGDWYLRPGIVVLFLATFGVIASAVLELWLKRSGRYLIGLAVIFAAIIEVFIVTNSFGFRTSEKPNIEFTRGAPDSRTEYDVAVFQITNVGTRDLHLIDRDSNARNAWRMNLEMKSDSNSYRVAETYQAQNEKSVISGDGDQTIGAEEEYTEKYRLTPGEYRIVLTPMNHTEDAIEKHLVIPEKDPEPAVPEPETSETILEDAMPESESVVVTSDPTDEPPEPAEPTPVENVETKIELPQVQLKGILQSADGSPRFSIVLTEDGKEEKLTLGLGEPLIGTWIVTEYNPGQSTITLQRENGLMIIRRGEFYSIDN